MHKLDLNDVTWTLPIVSVFSGLEPSMAATLCCVPLLKPLLGLGKRRRLPPRVKVMRNTLRTYQYDPEQADKLILRADRAIYLAEVVVDEAVPRAPPSFFEYADSDGSTDDLKMSGAPEILVSKQWTVTRETGDWTQILGSR